FTWTVFRIMESINSPVHHRDPLSQSIQWLPDMTLSRVKLQNWLNDEVVWLGKWLNQEPLGLWMMLKFGLPILVCYAFVVRPIGQVLAAFADLWKEKHLAIIGLGSGTLASYGQKGQKIDYYEIDPAVVRIAQNPAYFTFYDDCAKRGATMRVILGDARLRLRD